MEGETPVRIACIFRSATNLATNKQSLLEIAHGASGSTLNPPIEDRDLGVTVAFKTHAEALNFVLDLWKDGFAQLLLPPARLP